MDVSNKKLIDQLNDLAKQARFHIVKTVAESSSPHHLGGSLSCVELLVALYFRILRINPRKPQWEDRDRFILSKGHAGLGLFAVLALRTYFSLKELSTINLPDSRLVTHLDLRAPGVDMATGSLGQGLSVGVGMALGAKLDKKKYKIYVLLGDGEIDSGQIWEAAMAAAKYKLDNLIVAIDFNKLQLDGRIEEVMPLEPLVDKWRMFNWHTMEIDGHDIRQILAAYKKASKIKGQPVVIIAHTIKGKGVQFLEGKKESHRLVVDSDNLKHAFIQAIKSLKK